MNATSNSSDSTFPSDVLASGLPVLVDFWGQWCAPCKAMAPMLDQLAAEYAGRAKIVKVEMDKNPKTANAFRVRAAPTLLLFKDGAVRATHIGMASKAQLTRLIDAAL